MNPEHRPHSYPRWKQQTNPASGVPPILSGQVWTGLWEQEQQMVATTVIKMCQALAHRPAKPTESESATYEHIC